jgi:hypothetical protein
MRRIRILQSDPNHTPNLSQREDSPHRHPRAGFLTLAPDDRRDAQVQADRCPVTLAVISVD